MAEGLGKAPHAAKVAQKNHVHVTRTYAMTLTAMQMRLTPLALLAATALLGCGAKDDSIEATSTSQQAAVLVSRAPHNERLSRPEIS